jgi:flagellin-like protein
MKGVSAVIATILMLMITIALATLAYTYISGTFTGATGIVIELDAQATTCSGTTITVYVRNSGTIATDTSKVTLSGTNSAGDTIAGGTCGNDDLNAGAGAVACDLTLTGTQGNNRVVVSGPQNTVSGTVYCSG